MSDELENPVTQLVSSAPSWTDWWREWRDDPENDPDLPYMALMGLSAEIVRRAVDRRMPDLIQIFASLESRIRAGDRETRELLVVGVVEGIQNLLSRNPESTALIESLLGRETARYWGLVNDVFELRRSWSSIDWE